MDRLDRRRTRRDAVRLLGLTALALPVALLPRAAGATHSWCRTDPIVRIDGQTADVLLSSHDEMRELATGPAKIVVTAPSGVPAKLVATDLGFGGWGYDVRFVESDRLRNGADALEVLVEVYAPARDGEDGPLPIKVDFTPRGDGRLAPGQAEGWANKWVRLRTG